MLADTPRAQPALLAAGLLVAASAGLAGCLQSEPPENPSQLDYIYRSDHGTKAPHPVTYEGGFREVRVEGPTLKLTPHGTVTVPPVGPNEVPIPARLVVVNATGNFTTDYGSQRHLSNETIQLADDDAFEVEGVAEVRGTDTTFRDGDARVQGPPFPAPPEVERATFKTVADGALVPDVRLTEDPQPGAEQGPRGSLTLEEGTYRFAAGPLVVSGAGTVDVPAGSGWLTVAPDGAPVVLRGEHRSPDQVRIDARELNGSVDAGASYATLQAEAVQWFEADRPWFEAAFEAAFEGGGRNRSVTLEEGENETFWVRGSEVGEVGTAVEMRPESESPTLNASFGFDWYRDTDPHALEQFVRAWGAAFEALLQDPATRTFEPGETRYIPLVVGAPNGTEPGIYNPQGWIHGENAKSARLTVEVTVVEG